MRNGALFGAFVTIMRLNCKITLFLIGSLPAMTLAIRLIKQIRGKHIHTYKEDAMLIRFFSRVITERELNIIHWIKRISKL